MKRTMELFKVHYNFALLLIFVSTTVEGQATVSTAACTASGVLGYKVNRCPEGWVRFKLEKCFKLFVNKLVSFDDALKICRQENSRLASIHSDEEHRFLWSYVLRDSPDGMLKNVWIGGMKKGKLWIWDDLSPFDYSNWLPGYPDEQVCAELTTHNHDLENRPHYYGRMATYGCNTTMNFICQKYQVDAGKVIYLK